MNDEKRRIESEKVRRAMEPEKRKQEAAQLAEERRRMKADLATEKSRREGCEASIKVLTGELEWLRPQVTAITSTLQVSNEMVRSLARKVDALEAAGDAKAEHLRSAMRAAILRDLPSAELLKVLDTALAGRDADDEFLGLAKPEKT